MPLASSAQILSTSNRLDSPDGLDGGSWRPQTEDGPAAWSYGFDAAPSEATASAAAPRRAAAPVAGAALVQALQRELIPRLARAHRRTLLHITPRDVELFTHDLVQADEGAVVARLDVLRQQGFQVQTLCLELLAPAARRLGAMWDDDRCDFTSVTLGVGILQRQLRAMAPGAWPQTAATGGPGAHGLQLLLAQAPQEQHSFGLSMAAQFFSGAGWGVTGGVGEAAKPLTEWVQTRHFDVIGFSVGSENHMDWLRQQVNSVRLASRNPDLVVMVGGPLFALRPHWAQDVGADLCPASVHEAPALAAKRVKSGG